MRQLRRLAAGKPAEGTVSLNAFHKGGTIKIVINDDGKGLHRDRALVWVPGPLRLAYVLARMLPQSVWRRMCRVEA